MGDQGEGQSLEEMTEVFKEVVSQAPTAGSVEWMPPKNASFSGQSVGADEGRGRLNLHDRVKYALILAMIGLGSACVTLCVLIVASMRGR